MAQKEATERLYWNADHSKLLKEGEEGAVMLAAAVGDPIPEVEGATVKAAGKVSDKAAEASGDKAAKK